MDTLTLMNSKTPSLRTFFLSLFKNRRGQFDLTYDDMESDTTGEPETDCNPMRNMVYEVRTTSGWKVFHRPGK